MLLILPTLLALWGVAACSAPAFVRENDQAAERFLAGHPGAEGFAGLTHYVRGGTAGKPKIIFVHGSPGSWKAFATYLGDPELGARAELISVDRPGYGLTQPGQPERSLWGQVKGLEPLLDLGDPRQPAILVGHSYGGAVIVRWAMGERRPDPRIRQLLVLAGAVDPGLEKKKWFQYPADWFWVRWLLPSDLDVCNQEIEALKTELEAMAPHWGEIRSEIDVIQGLDDDMVPPANAEYIEAHASKLHPRIQRIPGLNHFIPWKRADLVRAALLQALDRLGSSP